eukprot:12030_3
MRRGVERCGYHWLRYSSHPYWPRCRTMRYHWLRYSSEQLYSRGRRMGWPLRSRSWPGWQSLSTSSYTGIESRTTNLNYQPRLKITRHRCRKRYAKLYQRSQGMSSYHWYLVSSPLCSHCSVQQRTLWKLSVV